MSFNPGQNQRILVIDDNQSIHEDFRKILSRPKAAGPELSAAEAALFGEPLPAIELPEFQLDFAFQGQEGLNLIERSLREGRPYAMAFVDVRMPPGWDGIETTAKIWKAYPDLQVVICTAYSDYSWEEMLKILGYSDRLIILKKPFDNIEVVQLAISLTENGGFTSRPNSGWKIWNGWCRNAPSIWSTPIANCSPPTKCSNWRGKKPSSWPRASWWPARPKASFWRT